MSIRKVLKRKQILRVTEDPLISSLKQADHEHKWIGYTEFMEKMINNKEITVVLIVLTEKFLEAKKKRLIKENENQNYFGISLIILCEKRRIAEDFLSIPSKMIQLILPLNMDAHFIINTVDQTVKTKFLGLENFNLQKELLVKNDVLRGMSRIGKLLGMEKDFSRLIQMILMETKKIVSADSGSVYIIERTKIDQKPTHLRFKSTSLKINTIEEFLLPINKRSIAGYVAFTGKPLLIDDVYQLSENEEYSFNPSFDKKAAYETKSMMTIPMKDHKDQVIGVIQLINRAKSKHKNDKSVKKEIIPFSNEDFELADAMAGQAGLTIENNFLIQDIQNLFEGFVTASVTAIEQRDPTTSGHSFRVAKFTIGLAEAVDRTHDKVFRDVKFNKKQIREIRYAALLHDFGKVGVKEEVLLKEKKLYSHELELIRWRYYLLREVINVNYLKNKINILENHKDPDPDKIHDLKSKKYQKLKELEDMFQSILHSNDPTILENGNFSMLKKMRSYMIQLCTGEKTPFLKNNEFLSLSVKMKGSLNQEERKEIESHVSHTFSFLKKIPWTQDLRSVPDIAHGHHEKLDGSGYPLGIMAKDICLQTRMMTISDMYDALTASDRPYKASLPRGKAIDILVLEANENRIDKGLLNVFIDAKIFNRREDSNA